MRIGDTAFPVGPGAPGAGMRLGLIRGIGDAVIIATEQGHQRHGITAV
jgi:hypothetical protein